MLQSTSLTNVTIPNKVTSIGRSAFVYCTSLTSITIPNSVESIEDLAFYGCTSLAAINVNDANTAYSSQDGVLYNKDKTTLVMYPAGKTGSFTIPNGVTSIGDQAFRNCTSLADVTIPNTVSYIGAFSFYSCTNLISVTFQATIPSSGFHNNAFYEFGDLRAKFYATDATNGTPGTYTTTAPVSSSSVWQKQP